jgi:putative peptidoglycan lipid II flippase
VTLREARPSEHDTLARSLLRATVLVAGLTVVVRLFGLLRHQVVAAEYGTGDEVDAFVFAYNVPLYAIAVLAGFVPSALVPVLARLDRRGRRELERELLGWSVLLFVAVTALCAAIWPLYLSLSGASFPPAKAALASRCFWIMLPSVFLSGVCAVWSAVLHAQKRFVATELLPGVVPLAIAGAVLGFGARFGGVEMACGHLAGVGLEFVLFAWVAARSGQALLPAPLRATPAVRGFLAQYLPLVGGGALMRSSTVVDQAMAATLAAGSLAALNYANAIVGAVLSLGATALGTAALPFVSDLAAKHDWAALRHALGSWTRLILWVSVPGTLALALGAELWVRLILEYGHFEVDDTRVVARVLAMYALQIPFFTLGMLCARVLSALRRNHLLLAICSVNVVVNVTLNWVLMRQLGAQGIALSTSCVYALSALLLAVVARRALARAEQSRASGSGAR